MNEASQDDEEIKKRKEDRERYITFLESSIDQAILTMPKDFEIKSFLEAHLMDAKSMLDAEYEKEMIYKTSMNEGIAQGVAKERNRLRQLLSMVAKETHRKDLQPVGEDDEFIDNLYKVYSIK